MGFLGVGGGGGGWMEALSEKGCYGLWNQKMNPLCSDKTMIGEEMVGLGFEYVETSIIIISVPAARRFCERRGEREEKMIVSVSPRMDGLRLSKYVETCRFIFVPAPEA